MDKVSVKIDWLFTPKGLKFMYWSTAILFIAWLVIVSYNIYHVVNNINIQIEQNENTFKESIKI